MSKDNPAVNAILGGRIDDTPSDEDALQRSFEGSGSTASVGKRSNDAARRELEAGEKFRREQTTGSMPPELFEVTEDQTETVPTVSPRMPARGRKAQLLTDEDIRSLAESGDYPADFMGEDYFVDPRRPTESALVYSEIKSPYEREEFLRNRKDYLLKQRKEKEARDRILQSEGMAVGAGLAVGLGGGVVAASSAGIGAFAAVVGQLPIFPSAMPLAKMAGAGYFVKKLYDDIRSDPNITEEEAQQKIQEEVQKQIQLQKDSGSPVVEEAIKTEEKINPDLFESYGYDVSPYDYLRTKPGTSEVEMTPEMIKRDEAALRQFLRRGSPKGR